MGKLLGDLGPAALKQIKDHMKEHAELIGEACDSGDFTKVTDELAAAMGCIDNIGQVTSKAALIEQIEGRVEQLGPGITAQAIVEEDTESAVKEVERIFSQREGA